VIAVMALSALIAAIALIAGGRDGVMA